MIEHQSYETWSYLVELLLEDGLASEVKVLMLTKVRLHTKEDMRTQPPNKI